MNARIHILVELVVVLRVRVRVRDSVSFRVSVRVGLEHFCERRSGDRTRVDCVCDFKKVPPDQLCPRTKRD